MKDTLCCTGTLNANKDVRMCDEAEPCKAHKCDDEHCYCPAELESSKATYSVAEREGIVREIQEQMQKETGKFLPGIAIRQILETITRNRKALDFLGRL